MTTKTPSAPPAREESGMEEVRATLEAYATRCVESEEMHAAPGCSPDESRTVIAAVTVARDAHLSAIARLVARAPRQGIEEARSLLLRMDEVLSNVANPVPGSLDPLESLRADIQRFLAAGKEG